MNADIKRECEKAWNGGSVGSYEYMMFISGFEAAMDYFLKTACNYCITELERDPLKRDIKSMRQVKSANVKCNERKVTAKGNEIHS